MNVKRRLFALFYLKISTGLARAGRFMNGFPGLKRIDQCRLTVKVFKRDVQVGFSSVNYSDFVTPEEELRRQDKKRSKIIRFSKRSARRLRHLVRNTEDVWKAFITLTYPENFPSNGRKVKNAFKRFPAILKAKKN